MRYSNRLRVLRAEVRITQMDLSAKAKISLNRYWRIENGYAEPTKTERAVIARLLKAEVSAAFPGSQPEVSA